MVTTEEFEKAKHVELECKYYMHKDKEEIDELRNIVYERTSLLREAARVIKELMSVTSDQIVGEAVWNKAQEIVGGCL